MSDKFVKPAAKSREQVLKIPAFGKSFPLLSQKVKLFRGGISQKLNAAGNPFDIIWERKNGALTLPEKGGVFPDNG